MKTKQCNISQRAGTYYNENQKDPLRDSVFFICSLKNNMINDYLVCKFSESEVIQLCC